MSASDDLKLLLDQQRKDSTRTLVAQALLTLHALRHRVFSRLPGDLAAWPDARSLAEELIRSAAALDLGILIACAEQVLNVDERRSASESLQRDFALELQNALDTLGMELERLRNDEILR